MGPKFEISVPCVTDQQIALSVGKSLSNQLKTPVFCQVISFCTLPVLILVIMNKVS